SGERPAPAARPGHVRHVDPDGQQPRTRRRPSPDAPILPRRSGDFEGARPDHREHANPRDLDPLPPELREAEYRAGEAAGTALLARALQRPRGGMVRPLAAFAGRPGGPRAFNGLGFGPGHLRAAGRSDELRGRPATRRMSGRKKDETPSGTSPATAS